MKQSGGQRQAPASWRQAQAGQLILAGVSSSECITLSARPSGWRASSFPATHRWPSPRGKLISGLFHFAGPLCRWQASWLAGWPGDAQWPIGAVAALHCRRAMAPSGRAFAKLICSRQYTATIHVAPGKQKRICLSSSPKVGPIGRRELATGAQTGKFLPEISRQKWPAEMSARRLPVIWCLSASCLACLCSSLQAPAPVHTCAAHGHQQLGEAAKRAAKRTDKQADKRVT